MNELIMLSFFQVVLSSTEGICAVELEDDLFYAPCNAKEYLEADYGPRWSAPMDPDEFVWHKSH